MELLSLVMGSLMEAAINQKVPKRSAPIRGRHRNGSPAVLKPCSWHQPPSISSLLLSQERGGPFLLPAAVAFIPELIEE